MGLQNVQSTKDQGSNVPWGREGMHPTSIKNNRHKAHSSYWEECGSLTFDIDFKDVHLSQSGAGMIQIRIYKMNYWEQLPAC